jgi:hypothetical protein
MGTSVGSSMGSSVGAAASVGASVAAGAQAAKTSAAKMMTAKSGYSFLSISVLLHRDIELWNRGD